MKHQLHSTHRFLQFTKLLVLIGLSASALGSCNTTAGLGRDMQKVGDKIEESANRHR